jgi:hypothetical protein
MVITESSILQISKIGFNTFSIPESCILTRIPVAGEGIKKE